MLPLWRQAAHELGMSNTQFNGAISKLYTAMDKAGLLEKPIDVKAELAKLEPRDGDPAARGAAAVQRVQAASSFFAGLVTRQVLTPSQAALFENVAATADGVAGIEAIMKEFGAAGGLKPGSGTGAVTDAEQAILDKLYPTMILK